ncbi:PIR protein, putative [Plasmodium sp. DRC-Itaito]|nr:PIR protein, putative [Plasmodium sp. DRC-Itaito]
MKLHCSKILLLFLPLNILVTSYQEHNNNEPHSTPHHTQTNRSLCECETQSSIYNKDEEMKSVMQQFVDRTSQRLREYDERIQDKRQKRKEERDKNIKKIIEKDKREKSLEQKIEKGCLRCGCGLGGVAASVGVFGGLGVYGSEMAATATAIAAAEKAGIDAGVNAVIAKIGNSFEPMLGNVQWSKLITGSNYKSIPGLVKAVNAAITSSKEAGTSDGKITLARQSLSYAERTFGQYIAAAKDITESTTTSVQKVKLVEVTTQTTPLYSAIGYSVLAILIIVLVMIIIYLVLRYRRKKKMKKKDQYAKLLEE